jgi:hypothetical protein
MQRETRELMETAFTSLCRPFRHLVTLIPRAGQQTVTNTAHPVSCILHSFLGLALTDNGSCLPRSLVFPSKGFIEQGKEIALFVQLP